MANFVGEAKKRVMIVLTKEQELQVKSKQKKLSGSNNDFTEYNKLSDYHKESLCASNYWRVLSGLSFISVPFEDTNFWYYFDDRCFELSVEFKDKLIRVKEANAIRKESEEAISKNKPSDIRVEPVILEEVKTVKEKEPVKIEKKIAEKKPKVAKAEKVLVVKKEKAKTEKISKKTNTELF